ncbi:MAG: prepilin-type N-terminal cleavage/methylation domain-containing protein [Candidatus Neomarinimicrobiota bacterium]
MRKYYRKNNGFTLLELIVVIATTGIISLIVLPNIGNTFNNVNLKLVTGKLMDDIRYVQNYAITNHRITWVTIDTDANSYSYGIYNTPPNADPQILIDPSTNQPAIIDLDAYSGITITSESLNGGFDFDWFGKPTNSGQIVLNNAKIVTIEDETGYVYEN